MTWHAVTSFLTYIVPPVLFGVLSSFLVVLFVESKKRPRLFLTAEAPQDASYGPDRPAQKTRFVRVVASNQQLPWYLRWMTRESAMHCRAEIRFRSSDGTDPFSGAMQGRWANNPQPVPAVALLGNTPLQIWDPNIWQLAGLGINIPAGEKEELDIAARFDDDEDAFAWSNASYDPSTPWRNPKCKLRKDRYTISVTIRSGGQKWTGEYELDNQGSREEMRLKKKQ